MKNFLFAFLVGASIGSSAQIGAKVQQQSGITGLWQNNQFGYQMTLMLNENGTGEFDGDAIRYTAQQGKLSLTVVSQNSTTVYSYTLSGADLTISGGDLDQPVRFTRAGGESPAPAVASSPSQIPPSGIDKDLIGTWSGNNESMEFRADGKCMYNGNPIDYQTSQGHIILSTAQGQVMMAYSITGNQMKLTVNGAQYTYTKGAAATKSAVAATPPAGRNIPQELAGKWCWMSTSGNYSSSSSRCIVLNANGTYTYSSESSRSVNTDAFSGGTASQSADSGTWWVEGERLHYISQTQGQGSYRLEKRNHPKNVNDPMIVLDGQPYVTATLKQPWR